MITIDPNKCPQNHTCPLIRLCPQGAISQEGFGLPKIDKRRCMECGICVENCRMGACQRR